MEEDPFIEQIMGMKPIQHVGYRSDRTVWQDPSGKLERTLAHEWVRINTLYQGGFLDRMLESYHDDDTLNGVPIPVTERDARVAATVIQWLGTNVGWSFICSALQKANYTIPQPIREKEEDDR